MGLLDRIRQHAAIASGNFAAMFADVRIPALPMVTRRLLSEFDAEEPDFGRLAHIISGDVELSARILRTVNSSLYGLSQPVAGLQQAMTLIGLKNLRALALAYSLKDALPVPESDIYDPQIFWRDSLLRALLARGLSERMYPGQEDEAFTVALLADLAVPVLLTGWQHYYTPVIRRWWDEGVRLSDLEQEAFGWDHSMAGAWILESWCFPEAMIGLVAAHNLSLDDVQDMGLDATLAIPLILAAGLPSTMPKRKPEGPTLAQQILEQCDLTVEGLIQIIDTVSQSYDEIRNDFGLADSAQPPSLVALRAQIETLADQVLS